MLHAAILAAALTSTPTDSATPAKTSVQQCFEAMDGAVYHGDPSNRTLMQQNIRACERGLAEVQNMHVPTGYGPAQLFILGRILDRDATLRYMGLDDAATALADVRRANLYFRIVSGLQHQSDDFHNAALANVKLTGVQLQTLSTDIASAKTHASTVALRSKHGEF